jgi:hypothetical protein
MHSARAEFRAVRQPFGYDARLFAIGVGHEGIRMRLILVGMGKHRPASLSVGSLRLPGAGIAIHGTV